MHHRTTYMHSNFQQNRVSRSVKTVHTNLFAKNCKLHKFVTCNWNFEKSCLSDMHHPLTDFMLILRSIGLLDIEIPRKEIISTDGQTDGQTDGWTDGTTDRRTDGQTLRTTIGSFFEKKILKIKCF